MDKEAQEKIRNILERYGDFVDGKKFMFDARDVLDIDEAFAKIEIALSTYRKLPKDEPPLLSKKAMDEAYIIPDKTQTWPYHLRSSIAQAQREADIKFYGGKE